MTEAVEILATTTPVNSLEAVFEKNTKLPQLRKFVHEQAKIFVMARMAKMILKYFSSVQDKITPAELQLAAELFVEEYPKIRLTEVDLIFRSAAKGAYGPTYEKISMERIMGWAKAYFEARQKWLSANQHRFYVQQKNEAKYSPCPPDILEKVRLRTEKEKDTHLNHNAKKLKRKFGI